MTPKAPGQADDGSRQHWQTGAEAREQFLKLRNDQHQQQPSDANSHQDNCGRVPQCTFNLSLDFLQVLHIQSDLVHQVIQVA